MTSATSQPTGTDQAADAVPQRRRRRSRPLIAAGALVVLVAAALTATGLLRHTGRSAAKSGGTAATSTATVRSQSLSSQQQVTGTLGYAGAYRVVNQAKGTVTALPSTGQVITEGHRLYAVDGAPVVLLGGSAPAYRSLSEGDEGADVAELNADLVRLGDATASDLDPASDTFTAATAEGLKSLQDRLGLPVTGNLPLGQAVFLPGPTRVTSVTATLGGPAAPGAAVLHTTSNRRRVVVQLDAGQQSHVHVGDRVTITLPDNSTTPGTVSSVGTVATCPEGSSPGSSDSGSSQGSSTGDGSGCGSSGSSGNASPTVTADIKLSDPEATGHIDQAPVQVSITTDTVEHALTVPVTALIAQVGGGYALEVTDSRRKHRTVPVTLGLFDDADGLVQVSGSGVHAGQRVVQAGS